MNSIESEKQKTKWIKTECNFCKSKVNLKPNCVSEIKQSELDKKIKLASLEKDKDRVDEIPTK